MVQMEYFQGESFAVVKSEINKWLKEGLLKDGRNVKIVSTGQSECFTGTSAFEKRVTITIFYELK